MPPAKAALLQHAKCANYQAAVWRTSLQHDVTVPSPDEQGWSVQEEHTVITWSTEKLAHDSALALITSCRCKKANCESSKCSCRQFKLPCTDLCQCVECQNLAEDGCCKLSSHADTDSDSDSDFDSEEE